MGKIFRKHVLICTRDGEGRCGQKGGLEIFQKFREVIRERGLEDLLSTQVGCTGQHSTGPVVFVHPDGVWYKEVSLDDVAEIVDNHLVNGNVVERLVNPERAVKS